MSAPFPIRANSKQQRVNKKNGGAAQQSTNPVTPSSATDPTTPTTPRHPDSFSRGSANFAGTPGQGGHAVNQPPQQPTPNPPHAVPPPPVANTNDTALASFGLGTGLGEELSLTFGDLDNGLDNFDFDSFLNTEDNAGGLTFDNSLGWDAGVETTAGDT